MAVKTQENSSNTDKLDSLRQLSEEVLELLERQYKVLSRNGMTLPGEIFEGLSELSDSLNQVKKDMLEQERELNRLYALAKVGETINSSLDLTTVLNEVMDMIISLTEAERGFLMLCMDNGTLDLRTARNMDRETLEKGEIEISRTIAYQVAESGNSVLTTNAQLDPRFDRQQSVLLHHLRSILCVPLMLKGKVTGVIYADNRVRSGVFTHRDLKILTAFANEAAVAIENARLFVDLQKSNIELVKAYEVTLEGWARALELRDQETEGHTRRVTELTVELATRFGIKGPDLDHVRRGALLHDIGKMGIPDRILLKPGSLTEEELKTMQQHPIYAYEMLFPIEKLRPALHIPYCHHEKWDGSGYPRGLKGEKIPLAARIFAVVDVWDALRSERPYRKPWPVKKVLIYIREQSGKHFDPMVVKVFLKLILEKL